MHVRFFFTLLTLSRLFLGECLPCLLRFLFYATLIGITCLQQLAEVDSDASVALPVVFYTMTTVSSMFANLPHYSVIIAQFHSSFVVVFVRLSTVVFFIFSRQNKQYCRLYDSFSLLPLHTFLF